MKSVSKSLLNRIAKINDMLPKVLDSEEIPHTYAGGTWPYDIDLTGPIEVKGKYVYIHEFASQGGYGFDKRYNVNNEGSLDQLKYDLTQITRAFKKVLTNNQ